MRTMVCQEFGPDNTPLSEMVFTLPLLARANASTRVAWRTSRHRRRRRRSVARRGIVKASLDQRHLDDIIARLNLTREFSAHWY